MCRLVQGFPNQWYDSERLCPVLGHCIDLLTSQPLYWPVDQPAIVLTCWPANRCIDLLTSQPLYWPVDQPTVVLTYWPASHCINLLTSQSLYWPIDQPVIVLTCWPASHTTALPYLCIQRVCKNLSRSSLQDQALNIGNVWIYFKVIRFCILDMYVILSNVFRVKKSA